MVNYERLNHSTQGAVLLAEAQSALWQLRYGFPQFMVGDAGARAAIEYQYAFDGDRHLQQKHVLQVKKELEARDFPLLPNPSHIVPVLVGNAELARQASDMLLNNHGIYVQAINYPTVPKGEERLRITPTPGHTEDLQNELFDALEDVWQTLNLKRTSDWAREGGHCGVGDSIADKVQPIWSEKHLRAIAPVEIPIIEQQQPVAPVSLKTGHAGFPVDNILEQQLGRVAGAV